jgi:DNA-binding NarL/FixJ family response regulator
MPFPLPPIHVALLDDHALFRQGMRFILQSLPYVVAVTEAATLAELQTLCRERLPDILLLDLQMPGVDGPEAAQVLLREFPDLKIIVLSMHDADTFVTQMIRLGARSYLPKDVSQEQLEAAIAEVLQTGYHYTTHVSQALMRSVKQPSRSRSTALPGQLQLTRREAEVLRLICEGQTAAEIGHRLCISHRTVEGHWQNLLDKTGMANVASLAVFAATHGLINTLERPTGK